MISLSQVEKTTEEWNSSNPILAQDAIGVEVMDNGYNRFKRGDGVTAWKSLPYIDKVYGGDGSVPEHSHDYLPLTGGAIDGSVTIDGKVTASSSGVLWINGRDGAAFKSTVQPGSTGSYLPLTSVKSYNGSWETGILGDVLYFVYGTDANYNAGTNTTMNGVYIYPDGTLYCENANVKGLSLVTYVGETLTCNTCACSGFVTNDANTIYFQVPLPKILDTAHNKLTVTTFKANIRKSTGGYIGAATSAVSGGYNYLSNSNYTVGISSYNPLSVEMFVRNDTTKFDATNNSPVALECYIQFKVS